MEKSGKFVTQKKWEVCWHLMCLFAQMPNELRSMGTYVTLAQIKKSKILTNMFLKYSMPNLVSKFEEQSVWWDKR